MHQNKRHGKNALFNEEVRMMKKLYYCLPFLFSLYPIALIYSKNLSQYPFAAVLLPALTVLFLSAAMLYLLRKLLHHTNKALVLLSMFWLWFFSYGEVRLFLFKLYDIGIFQHRYAIPSWIMLFVLVVLVVLKSKRSFGNLLDALSIFLCILMLFLIMSFASAMRPNAFSTKLTKGLSSSEGQQASLTGKKVLPNVYYIIFDAYAGERGLRKSLGFDNSETVAFLRKRGFFVGDKSCSNYSWTTSSLASSLNMQYLPMVASNTKNVFMFDRGLDKIAMINNNEVVRRFKAAGYKYMDLSIWDRLEQLSNYEVPSKYRFSSLFEGLLSMTILWKPVGENYIVAKAKRAEILGKVQLLKSIAQYDVPTFTYAHIMIPHEPFVFDRYGNEYGVFTRMFHLDDVTKLYLDQLMFASVLIRDIVDTLLKNSKIPPIIVIQGDHGSGVLDPGSDRAIQLRMSILNAYYFPSDAGAIAYDSVSPVNTFRLIFNYVFHDQYDLLPDKGFYQTRDDPSRPLKFVCEKGDFFKN
jgi:hypothetical protein